MTALAGAGAGGAGGGAAAAAAAAAGTGAGTGAAAACCCCVLLQHVCRPTLLEVRTITWLQFVRKCKICCTIR